MTVALSGALLALAGLAWGVAAERMAGMDAAPGADLGGFGWFAVTWLVMMAAMMLPALVPAATRLARGGRRTLGAFVAGYLGAWTAAGVIAYMLVSTMRGAHVWFLAWDRTGRYIAAGVILLAAAYQLTAAKSRCLERCRNPRVRAGVLNGARAGMRHGADCIGCCAVLMAALFALGVMSLTWMGAIAVLIAGERLSPWPRPAVYGGAAALVVLGVWIAVAPADLPGLVLPGAAMSAM